jgi:hypothetical protein
MLNALEKGHSLENRHHRFHASAGQSRLHPSMVFSSFSNNSNVYHRYDRAPFSSSNSWQAEFRFYPGPKTLDLYPILVMAGRPGQFFLSSPRNQLHAWIMILQDVQSAYSMSSRGFWRGHRLKTI